MSFLPYASNARFGWLAAGTASVLAHAALVAGLVLLMQERFRAPPAPERNEFTITLDRLDSNTLAGLIEQQGEAGSQGDTAEGDLAEGTDPTEADTAPAEEVAALEPDQAIPPEPPAEDPQEALPEVPQEEPAPAVEPEAPTPAPEPEVEEAQPLEAETLAPEEVTTPSEDTLDALAAQEIAPLDPVAEEAQPAVDPADQVPLAVPDPVTPLDPVAPVSSPLVPETVTASGSAETLAPLAPAGQAPETVAPLPGPAAGTVVAAAPAPQTAIVPPASGTAEVVASVTQPVPNQPPVPARPAAAPPQTAQDLAIAGLIRRIQASVGDPCLLALPRRDGTAGVGLAMIASEDGAMERFTNQVLTEEGDAALRQTRTLVDPRQCPALTYVRRNADYPVTRLGLALDAGEVPSGGNLTGYLRGVSGRYVLLLLVDNNGVVQDLQRFVTFSGNYARFDVPVTRVGAPRDTSQLLLAIATSRPANQIRDRAGQLAQDVFAGLTGELEGGAALAITTFDVR